jgi:hypothetical protein
MLTDQKCARINSGDKYPSLASLASFPSSTFSSFSLGFLFHISFVKVSSVICGRNRKYLLPATNGGNRNYISVSVSDLVVDM